jgi:hypothetical protein
MSSAKRDTLRIFRTQGIARSAAALAAAVMASGWGCLSMQSQSTLDGAGNNVNNSNSPFVEAYVEYPGPQAKWAGPASFILHVSAKDAGLAAITTTPELLVAKPGSEPGAEPVEVLHRAPASQPGSASQPNKKMTSEEARSQLAHLANALQGAQAPFRGCMSPLRVRLVRADGGIFERQGCRSELGWSRAVSETVSVFEDASINGVHETASAGDASSPHPGGPARAISSETASGPSH